MLVLPSDFYIYISLKNKVRMNAEIGCIGEVSMNFIMHIYIYLRGIIVYNLLHHFDIDIDLM